MKKDVSPLEGVLAEIFRGLSPVHKGKLLGIAEELRLAEVTPLRKSKKADAVPKRSGERHPI